jgi:membrane associated rhomboid family serine protease
MIIPIRVTQRRYSFPWVTMALVCLNALVFLHEIALDSRELNHFMMAHAFRPLHPSLYSALTSMFLHANWTHLIGNMLFLWVFGGSVEDALGHGKFLFFYLLCGYAGVFTQMAADPFSRLPMLGASGAIAGVMGAYLAKFPRSRVVMLVFVLLIFTFEVPAWGMLVYWFAMQFLSGLTTLAETRYLASGGTAYLAHVGGFLAGVALISVMSTRERSWRRDDTQW